MGKKVQNSKNTEDAIEDDGTSARVDNPKKDSLKNESKEKNAKLKNKNHEVFKFGAEASKNVQEQEKSSKGLKCELCNYNCEKETTLNKHVLSKHTKQKCTVCGKEFGTSIELLSHIAREHHEQEEACIQFQSTPKSHNDKEGESEGAVHCGAMLDENL